MSKQEETYNINDELIDEKVVAPVKSNKIKYTIAILAATTLIAATSVLLIGHFKFNWFQSETYKLDAKINRAIYQANYFTENKKINAAFTFSNGNHEEKDATVSTDFVVYLTKREKTSNDYLNTASLIILNSQVQSEEKTDELTSFNIFEESTLKELEANPDGSKYPMAVFSFYENGSIKEIKLPNNMDKYNAESIIELIGNVIPKLTRNRKEDMSNGLEIKEIKSKNVKTIVETQAPREHPEFKGSRYSKIVERDIEDNQVSNIRVTSSAYFQSEDENLEVDDLGMKDFQFNTKSEIAAVSTNENKENAELIQKITDKFTFVTSEELIASILEQERKENEIAPKLEDTPSEEEPTPLRNLGFPFNADKTFNLKTISFAGQSISIKLHVGVSSSRAIIEIILSSGMGTFRFGNNGVSACISKTWSGRVKLFSYRFPPFPVIYLAVYGGGSIGFSVSYTSGNSQLKLSVSGSLTATAEIGAGSDKVLRFAAGATGTILSASGYASVSRSGVSRGFSISGGRIEVYVVASAFGKQVWRKSAVVFNGWSS